MLEHVPPAAWAGLGLLVVACLAIDLFAHRGDHVDSRHRAVLWTAAWISVSLVFAAGLWVVAGAELAEEFLAVWLLEKCLSVDNLFVFLVVFEVLQVPRGEQRRVLSWGIIGALLTRAVFIGVGTALLERWHGLVYLFGALLVVIAVKLLRSGEVSPTESRFVALMRRVMPMTASPRGHHFLVREHGRWLATPLLLSLVVVEGTDVMFAIDSIPAAFAVSEQPFVIYSANVFAIFGLRSLFMVLADALKELRYLKPGLAAVLLVAGAKMLASGVFHPPAWASLLAIVAIMGIAIGASLVVRRTVSPPPMSGAVGSKVP